LTKKETTYTHGHHESVLRSHRSRTVANSAAYLVGELRPGIELLDVGCGPGTITVDLARHIDGGRVVGVDRSAEVVEAARAEAASQVETLRSSLELEVADIYDLAFGDASFDVVHAHQVLQHLGDPVAALVEMRRVCRPGGVVAARDSDYASMHWFPVVPELDRWLELYHLVARHNGAEPDAGRRLLAWAHAAGFEDIVPTTTSWSYTTPDARSWWGGLWSDRILHSSVGTQILELGLAGEDELHDISEAWLAWAAHPDGWFAMVHGEVLCRA